MVTKIFLILGSNCKGRTITCNVDTFFINTFWLITQNSKMSVESLWLELGSITRLRTVIIQDGFRRNRDYFLLLCTCKWNICKNYLQEVLTPSICAQIAMKMTSWGGKKTKLPVMEFPEFYKKVSDEIDGRADERLVRLAVGYLHNTGEVWLNRLTWLLLLWLNKANKVVHV